MKHGKFCSTFDLLQQNNLKLGKLMTDNCLSGVISRKSVIIPSDAAVKDIEKMKNKEKQLNVLMCHILLFRYTPEQLKVAAENKKEIKTINGRRFDVEKVDSTTFKLNGKKIKVIDNIDDKYYIFKASSKLSPHDPETDKKVSKKASKKVDKNISNFIKTITDKKASKKASKKGGKRAKLSSMNMYRTLLQ